MQLSGLAQLIVRTTQALFVQLIVNLKLCFPPLMFSFPAFSFQVFDRCGVSPGCFLFAQGALDCYRCNSFHYIQSFHVEMIQQSVNQLCAHSWLRGVFFLWVKWAVCERAQRAWGEEKKKVLKKKKMFHLISAVWNLLFCCLGFSSSNNM